MMFQQRSISGACCLLFLALGAAAVSPAARTTGALDVVLSFEGMTQNTFEQKYVEGSRMAIAKVAGVPGDYVSYHGRFATASTNPNEAVAHFRVRTTSDTWGQRTTVRRKLLASAAANGQVFYSYMGRFGAPFRPAMSVDGVDILYGSQAGHWDTPKSRFVDTASPGSSSSTASMYLDPKNLTVIGGGDKPATDLDSGALVASATSNSSTASDSTGVTAAAAAASSAAGTTAGAAAAAGAGAWSTSPLQTSLPLKVFVPVVVLGVIIAILAVTAAGIVIWRLSKATRQHSVEEDFCEDDTPGAPVQGSGVVLYSSRMEENDLPATKGSPRGCKSQQQPPCPRPNNPNQTAGKQSSRRWR